MFYNSKVWQRMQGAHTYLWLSEGWLVMGRVPLICPHGWHTWMAGGQGHREAI